ncbi:hypothetical protein B9T62_00640 [Paenibacillus donghaensis]|uniref:Uncharacterized protein n=1 Tax=Paenibacillus donghaensis TaxID=414771 RepID=A0A2Z2K4V6_9BACL|nr:hypothetical protein B9T62_00640 [Paenibacillus donghaensis]
MSTFLITLIISGFFGIFALSALGLVVLISKKSKHPVKSMLTMFLGIVFLSWFVLGINTYMTHGSLKNFIFFTVITIVIISAMKFRLKRI